MGRTGGDLIHLRRAPGEDQTMIKTMLKWAFGAPMHIDDEDWEDSPPKVSDGYPDNIEFRVSPGAEQLAIWNPRLKKWIVFHEVVTDREVHPLDTSLLDSWTPYLAVED